MIIAHRGVHNNKDVPENSIIAFEKTINRGYAIEFDIQITKDNRLVIFHDDNMKRMTGIDKNIQDLYFDEVRNINLLDTKYNILEFCELLNLVNGKVLLDIEIKSCKKVNEVCDFVLKELDNYNGPLMLKSFDPRIVKCLKNKTDKYPIGLLVTYNSGNKLLNILVKTKLIYSYTKPSFIAFDKKMLNKKFYNKFKKYPLFMWTIDGLSEMKKFEKEYSNINYICNKL